MVVPGVAFCSGSDISIPNDKVTLEVKPAVSDITESLTIKLKRRSDFLNEPNH